MNHPQTSIRPGVCDKNFEMTLKNRIPLTLTNFVSKRKKWEKEDVTREINIAAVDRHVAVMSKWKNFPSRSDSLLPNREEQDIEKEDVDNNPD